MWKKKTIGTALACALALGAWSGSALATPVKLDATPAVISRAAPLLGQHTDEVLTTLLAMSSAEIARLRDDGVIV